ncbi:MAG: chromate transporter [Nitrospirota bacterium]|nr:chromate transporter [Nitrospirota bacterium]
MILAGSDLSILITLLWTFLKVGALIFGGGYVMIPYVEDIVVNQHHWLTRQEFIDAIAAGQATPGPIVVSAAFIGYRVWGMVGGLLSLFAILIPSFVLLMLLVRKLSLFSKGRLAEFLRGMFPAAVGIIMAVAFNLGKTALVGLPQVAIAVVAFILLARLKVDPPWVIVGSGVVGVLLLQ